jgi:glucosamine--fructose-6-phosphate aminotransferase (isomerizing)
MVQTGFPMLLFAQNDESRDSSTALAAELAGSGAALIVAGCEAPGALILPTVAAHPSLQPILMILSFYRLVEALARARGMDPDRPPHLSKVTETV